VGVRSLRVPVRSGKRLVLLAVVASLCATAAVAIGTLLFGDFGETEGKILLTTAAISFYSLLALPGGILLDQRRLRALAAAAIALAVASFVLAMTLLWSELDSDGGGKLLLTLTAFAVAATQIAASASRTRAGDAAPVRRLFFGASALVLVVASMVAVLIWAEVDSETYVRVLGALVVANVLLVVLQPVLRRVAAPSRRPSHRLLVLLADGEERELEVEARDFAEAVAQAVRQTERDGGRVERIERRSAS
jgi:hypothetical protein